MDIPTIAREYQRVSDVARGGERSPEEQHGDNQRAADRLGWTLGPAYRDKVSASRYGRKVREDYARLVDDLEHDRFGASVLILWESSRGSRQMSEWVRLLELCEQRGVRIYVTADHKLYDPADARDRKSLLEDAIDAEYESTRTSKRVTRSMSASAADGRPGPGKPPYGYRRFYDPASGRMAGQEVDPEQAAIVREVYDRLNTGHSLRSIALDLEARGVRTREGKVINQHTLRSVALNRAYIGERVHDPGRQGRPYGKPSELATIVPATWPAIVDRALWTAVHRRLTDPSRKTTRPGRGKHWLSLIARCDVCGGEMQAYNYKTAAGPELAYACHQRTCVRVLYEPLTAYVEAVLLAYLARDDIAHHLTAEPVEAGAVAAVDAEIAAIEMEIDDLAARLGAGGAAARKLLERSLPIIEARLTAARARREELTAPSLLRGLIKPGKDVRRRWAAVPMPARREVARILFVPDLLGELRIVKGPLRDPIAQRVVWSRS